MNKPASSTFTVARIDFLEGLRGFLAVWVMFAHVGLFVGLAHLDPSDRLPPGIIPLILNYFDFTSTDAVNVFMILSGFVIFNLLDRGRETYPAYIIRRFFRLWPIFIVCVIFGLLIDKYYIQILQDNPWSNNFWIHTRLAVALVIQRNYLPYFLVDIPMVHGLVPDFILSQGNSAFSPLAWCISTEWQFYLLAPLFFRLTKNALGTGLIAGFILFSMAREHTFDIWINPSASLLPLQLHWFFLGMISYLIYRDVEANGLGRSNKTKIVLMLCFIVCIAIFKRRLAIAAGPWLIAFVTLIDLVTTKRNPLGRLVRGFYNSHISRYFGRISYPIYLIHWPIIILVTKCLIKFHPELSWASAYVILITSVPLLTWGIAHLAHHFLEAPAMNLGKRIASRFPRRDEPGAARPLPVQTEKNQAI